MKHFNLLIEDFGLIEKADITLKPLTIFLGENNTGKSYIAQLIYALTKSISHMREPLFRYTHPSYRKIIFSKKYNTRTIKAFKRRLPSDLDRLMSSKKETDFELQFRDLPEIMAKECGDLVKESLLGVQKSLERELKDAYGVRINELNSKLKPGNNFIIRIENNKPLLKMAFSADKNHLRQHDEVNFSFRGVKVKTRISPIYRYLIREREYSPQEVIQWLMFLTIRSSVNSFADIFPKNAYYFPAARSGILQGQKLIARAGLRSLKRAGINAMSMSKLPGVVVDFLDQIYSIDKDISGDMENLSRNIEKRLIAGAVGIIEKREELPEIYFNVKKAGRFPLHRTSSMVSELAPIILMLRYLIDRDDIIILEEPESHLHPKLQREFAKIIANFVRSGLTILITTHSDYFVEQLSNIIALSSKEENIKNNLGYTENDIIYENEVGAYRFVHGKGGFTIVKGLKINQAGISDAGFGVVAEDLYDESVEAKRSRS